jgi:hypothetical protein
MPGTRSDGAPCPLPGPLSGLTNEQAPTALSLPSDLPAGLNGGAVAGGSGAGTSISGKSGSGSATGCGPFDSRQTLVQQIAQQAVSRQKAGAEVSRAAARAAVKARRQFSTPTRHGFQMPTTQTARPANAAYAIKGSVLDPDANPLDAIYVELDTPDGNAYGSSITDVSGQYSIPAGPGDYYIFFADPANDYGFGYFSNGGFTYDRSAADLVSVVDADVMASVLLPKALLINGVVSDSKHDPIAGVEVDVYTAEGLAYAQATTPLAGSFRVNVVPGDYYLFFGAGSGYGSGYWTSLGLVFEASSAEIISVTGQSVTANIEVPKSVFITGAVTASTGGQPVAGVDVWIMNSDQMLYADTTTDANGQFRASAAPGAYYIAFVDPTDNLASVYYSRTGPVYDWDFADPVFVSDSNVSITIELPKALHISGKVTRAGGAELAGMDVYADTINGYYSTTTKADGTYSVDVGPGPYILRVSDPKGDYATGFLGQSGFTFDAASAGLITVTVSDVTGKNVTLPPALRIKGKVTVSGGIPLGGVSVTALAMDGLAAASTTTGVDGSYALSIVSGTYVVYFDPNDGIHGNGYWSTTGFRYLQGQASPTTVTSSDVTGRNVALPNAAAITGTVTDGTRPLENVMVQASSSDGTDVETVWTDTNGSYVIPVGPGKYTIAYLDRINARSSGYYLASAPNHFTYDQDSATVVAIATSDVDLDVALPAAATISGKVSGGGQVRAGIEVIAIDRMSRRVDNTLTDASGAYSLTLTPDQYAIAFVDPSGQWATGYYCQWSPTKFQFADGSTVSVGPDVLGADVILPAALHVRGTIMDTSGHPLIGVSVFIGGSDVMSRQITSTDDKGGYLFTAAPSLTYVLGLYDEAGRYSTAWWTPDGLSFSDQTQGTFTLSDSDLTMDFTLPNAVHIKGKVMDGSGHGIAGVNVSGGFDIRNYTPGFGQRTTTSGVDGTYSLEVAPNQIHMLRFIDTTGQWGNGWYRAGSPTGFGYGFGGSDIPVAESDVTGINITLPAPVHLSGRITNSAGVGLSGIELCGWKAYQWADYDDAGCIRTLADGTYAFTVTPNRSYQILVIDPTGFYATGFYHTSGFTYLFSNATVIPVASSSVTGRNIVLPKALYIKGICTRVTDGESCYTGVVAFNDQGSFEANVDQWDDYAVQVGPGTYYVAFDDGENGWLASGYYGQSGFTYFKDEAVSLSVTTASIDLPAVTIPSRVCIRGTVTDSSGTPLKNVLVTIASRDGRVSNAWTTGTDGKYAVYAAPETYTVWFSDPTRINGSGYFGNAGFTTQYDQASPVTVTDGDVTGIDVRMSPGPAMSFPASTYFPIQPRRILDTRHGTEFGLSGQFTAGKVRTFHVAGASYMGGTDAAIPANAVAVTGNVTVVGMSAAGLVALGPTTQAGGSESTISFTAGDIRANNVTLGLAADGTLAAVYRAAPGATTDVIFDVTGYFMPTYDGATYHTLAPGRVLDTRGLGLGLRGKFANKVVRSFGVSGVVGRGWSTPMVPGNATAITGNLTVTNATSKGYVALGPTTSSNPSTSTLNTSAYVNRANGVTVALNRGRLQAVWVGTAGSSADVIFDVTGFFTHDLTGLKYHAVQPTTVLDTATGVGPLTTFANRLPQSMPVLGGQVNAAAKAISGNLTVVNPRGSGYVFISPQSTTSPSSSTVNVVAHQNVANGFDVGLGAGNVWIVWVGVSTADVQLDVTGYWE